MTARFPVLIRIIPMMAVMGIIFFLSHQTGEQIDMPDLPFFDKVAHFIVYAVLAVTVLFVPTRKFKQSRPIFTAVLAISLCIVYGIGDEFHQSFIPNRTVSGADVFADTLGAICVSLFWLKRIKSSNES